MNMWRREYECAEVGNSRRCARAVYNHRKLIAYLLSYEYRRKRKRMYGKIIDCVAISYPWSAHIKKKKKLKKNTRHLAFVVNSFNEMDNDQEI
jgi:hypothetical protein